MVKSMSGGIVALCVAAVAVTAPGAAAVHLPVTKAAVKTVREAVAAPVMLGSGLRCWPFSQVAACNEFCKDRDVCYTDPEYDLACCPAHA
jgi:hypothetical protein